MGPGRGPEMREGVFVRSQAAVGQGDEHQEPHRTPHVPEAWTPQGRKRWNPADNSFYSLPSSSPSFLLFRLRGPVGPVTAGSRGQGEVEGGHLCPIGKVDVGSRERISFPSTGERRGVSPSALQTAFLPGASERGCLLSKGKSSDQWIHATEFVQTTA